MPSINMIAPRRAEKRRLERDMRRLAIVIMVEIVFALGLGGYVFTQIYTTRSTIADLDVQITKLQPAVKQIEDYDRATAMLKPKVDLLNQAKASTLRWYGTLDRLTQCFPPATWLTRVSSDAKAEVGSMGMNLTGVSIDQSKVGEAMMKLHSVPDFSRVDLHFTQRTNVGGATAIEFEIGTIMGAGSQAQQTKEVTKSGSGQS